MVGELLRLRGGSSELGIIRLPSIPPPCCQTVSSPSVLILSGPRVWREYVSLCKPKVVALIVFTAIVGMLLASPGMVPIDALVFGTLGIGGAAAAGAAINHLADHRIDAMMARTSGRPIPSGKVDTVRAAAFAAVLCVFSMALLIWGVNALTAVLTFGSLVGYAVIYSLFLKRATPQNIVIGGLPGRCRRCSAGRRSPERSTRMRCCCS